MPSGEHGHILDQITGILKQFAGVVQADRDQVLPRGFASGFHEGPVEILLRYAGKPDDV